jgi:Flp pilus assembly protein TadG
MLPIMTTPSAYQRFARDQDGSIAIYFAMLLLPMFAIMGAAIDYSNMLNARSLAKHAIEDAVLVASRDQIKSLESRAALAEQQVMAKLSQIKGATVTGVSLTKSGDRIEGKASVKVQNAVLSILGLTETTVVATASAREVQPQVRPAAPKPERKPTPPTGGDPGRRQSSREMDTSMFDFTPGPAGLSSQDAAAVRQIEQELQNLMRQMGPQ